MIGLKELKTFTIVLVTGVLLSVVIFIVSLNGEIDSARDKFNLKASNAHYEVRHFLHDYVVDIAQYATMQSDMFLRQERDITNEVHSSLARRYKQVCFYFKNELIYHFDQERACSAEQLTSLGHFDFLGLDDYEFKLGTNILQFEIEEKYKVIFIADKNVLLDDFKLIFDKELLISNTICLYVQNDDEDILLQCLGKTNRFYQYDSPEKMKSVSQAFLDEIIELRGVKFRLVIIPDPKSMGGVVAYPFIIFFLFLFITGLTCFHLFKAVRHRLALEKSNKEIKDSYIELEVKNKGLEQFSYMAAHDLQSPLRNLISISHILQDDIEDGDLSNISSSISEIQEESSKMLNFVRDLLHVCSASAEEIEFSEFNIKDLINAEHSRLIKNWKEVLVDFKLELEVEEVFADRTMMNHIFRNLFDNSVKYVSEGHDSVSIKVTNKINDSGFLEFSIRDDGSGIEVEMMDKVFQPFRKEKSNKKGSGIGLAIVYTFIEKHAGEIWVESIKGEYTEIKFKIPNEKK